MFGKSKKARKQLKNLEVAKQKKNFIKVNRLRSCKKCDSDDDYSRK